MRLIASADLNWGIGMDGKLLYRTSADMLRLRKMTMGQVLLMGGRTFRGLPNGALPGRVNVVLSRDSGLRNEKAGICVAGNPDEALLILAQYPDKEHLLFGGGEIYRIFLPYCTRADITRYAHTRQADTFLPRLDETPGWVLAAKSPAQEENGLWFWYETWAFSLQTSFDYAKIY